MRHSAEDQHHADSQRHRQQPVLARSPNRRATRKGLHINWRPQESRADENQREFQNGTECDGRENRVEDSSQYTSYRNQQIELGEPVDLRSASCKFAMADDSHSEENRQVHQEKQDEGELGLRHRWNQAGEDEEG